MKCRSLAALGMTAAALRMTAAALGMTALLAITARAQTTDVALGIEALARRDVRAAEAAFRRGTTSDNPLIRPAAWQWLGHVAWKFKGDRVRAAAYLERALAEARDSSQIQLEVARLAGARQRHLEAVRTAHAAMLRSGDAERRGVALRTIVALAEDGAFSNRYDRMADSIDLPIVAGVRDSLRARVSRFPGRSSDAIALINAAAMLGDSAGVRAGVRSYFALVDGGLSAVADSIVDAITVQQALTRGRLYQSLALYERAAGMQTGREPSEVIRYADFLHNLRNLSELANRASVTDSQRVGQMLRSVNSLGQILWRTLSWPDAAPTYYPAALYRELGKRYGAVISLERSRGRDELFFAHQLGVYKVGGAPIVVLDGAIASGIDDWFLEGTGGRAGWVANDTIYERRTSFTETPFRALAALTDPQTIPGELFRMSRDSVGDLDRARFDSLGYLPGVAARVFRSGAQALLDSVQAAGAFTRAMYDNLVRSSIHLHESRHRADARSGRRSTQADDELRAKVDEVTGARLPRLALTAILSPNIGDSSPHGQANRRIMIGLNRWIRRNGAAIANYDARVPALLQLPLLTDAQLRAAFESMRTR